MDAGSTGTRLSMYTWPARSSNEAFPDVNTAPVGQVAWSKKLQPGISDFVSTTEKLGPYLGILIEFAKSKLTSNTWASTPVFLKATAGMRMLPSADAVVVLNYIRSWLSNTTNSPFFFKRANARILAGEEEGVFGWLTVNSLLHTMDPPNSVAALDMGGASTQITFVPDETPLSDYYNLVVGSRRIDLYTHSFLRFGYDQALGRLNYNLVVALNSSTIKSLSNPCLLTGYSVSQEVFDDNLKSLGFYNVIGTSSYSKCKDSLVPLLGMNAFCAALPCGPLGNHQPYFPASMKLVLFAGYFYTAQFFNCTGNQSVGCTDKTASSVCNKNWNDFNATFPSFPLSRSILALYCFQSAYMTVLLTEGYKLQSERVVTFAASLGGPPSVEVGWSLGSMITEAGAYDVACTDSTDKLQTGWVVLIACCCFVVGLILSFAVLFCFFKKNNQNKDVEI